VTQESPSTKQIGMLPWLLIALGAAARLLPHPPNFTPVGGCGIFAGAQLRGWRGWSVPLLAMILSDAALTFVYGHGTFSRLTPIIYLCMLLNVWIGRAFVGRGAISSVAGTLLGSVQFFVITNFAVWAFSTRVPHNGSGLVLVYTLALPFFGYTVAGDAFYTAALFGMNALARRVVSRKSSRSNATRPSHA
jgi:hypothetical protein